MTIHFAPARRAAASPLARSLGRGRIGAPANDCDTAPAAGFDAGLEMALRHFAQHGLGAARQARLEAEAARARGDDAAFGQWAAICAALDRQEARELEQA